MLDKNNRIIPLSIIAAGIIIAGALIFVSQKTKNSSVEGLSLEVLAEKAITYINENLLSSGLTASLVESSDAGSVYKIRLVVKENENVLGELDSYISKDGEFLFPEGYSMKQPIVQETEEADETEESSVPQEELTEFVGCLAEADFVIYGANWCGYTKNLVTMLGGWGMVKPIYVECTEETDLCQEKEITSYPTILINGKKYQGNRTFEGFSEVTGCQAPEGTGSLNEQNPTSECQ